MAPLALFDENQQIIDESTFREWISMLSKQARVDGIMIDVWWGLTEQEEQKYNFDGYEKVFNIISEANLKIIPVFSFHQCGGNVGDECNIPLPNFVTSQNAFWKDEYGNTDFEYISIGYDNVKIGSRTPVQMYSDWMNSFNSTFIDFIQSGVISVLEIGLGPCGELRYPSYQLQQGRWNYPGCGAFQAYDDQLTQRLQESANADGHPEYGHHPENTGGYNVFPEGSQFWTSGQPDSWDSIYGKWYLQWYENQLIHHSQAILQSARNIFPEMKISAKIAGIHWWYLNYCHCAEFTAGFFNYVKYDGYRDILTAFKIYHIGLCFTCLEMEKGDYDSDPPGLVSQLLSDAKWAQLRFEGENALEMYDDVHYNRIFDWIQKGLETFTYLRMTNTLFLDDNFQRFCHFVEKAHS